MSEIAKLALALAEDRDKYKAMAGELAEAVAHLRCCRTCAEDGEDCCENGGRQAIAALARYNCSLKEQQEVRA
jgi:hypothetical protein